MKIYVNSIKFSKFYFSFDKYSYISKLFQLNKNNIRCDCDNLSLKYIDAVIVFFFSLPFSSYVLNARINKQRPAERNKCTSKIREYFLFYFFVFLGEGNGIGFMKKHIVYWWKERNKNLPKDETNSRSKWNDNSSIRWSVEGWM